MDEDREYPLIDDSKKLAPGKRGKAFWFIMEHARSVSLGIVSQSEIDRTNILMSTLKAMTQAVMGLDLEPDFLLIDGTMVLPEFKINDSVDQRAIPYGDGLSVSIGAASIIAKVVRDRIMVGYDRLYPEYGFASHKGYATSAHVRAINLHGPCPIHRKSFKKVLPEPKL